MIDIDRTSNIETLRQVAKIQDAEIRRLHEKVQALAMKLATAQGASLEEIQVQLRLLQEQLDESYRKTRSGGSERRPREDAEKETPEERPAKKGHGPTPQPKLPIVEVPHVLDEPDRACAKCGGELSEWKGETEDSEEVDVVELQYVLKKHKRQKYRCACGCVETALGPEKLIVGGRYSVDFAVHVAVEKYCYHMPLQRQATRMRRGGLFVQASALWDQVWALSLTLKEAAERLHQYILSQEVVLIDETRWPLLGAKTHETKNWFVWGLVADKAIDYTILDSRSAEAGARVLRNFSGVAVGDGYVVYEVLANAEGGGFTLANDWCHARRKFLEAEASSPDEAKLFLDDIGELFGIERELEVQTSADPPAVAAAIRAREREQRSKPVVARIGQRAMEVKALRESPIAKAVKYLENRWEGLTRFLHDGRIPITSNGVEAALRNPVLGRNNHFGSKSVRGTQVAAIFYSFVESAKLNGLDPAAYLKTAALAHIRGQTVPLPHEI